MVDNIRKQRAKVKKKRNRQFMSFFLDFLVSISYIDSYNRKETIVSEEKKWKFKDVIQWVGGVAILAVFTLLITENISKRKQLTNLHNRMAEVAQIQRYQGDRLASDIAFLHNNITKSNQTIRNMRREIKTFSDIALRADSVRIVTVSPKPVVATGDFRMYPINWYGQGVNLEGAFTMPDRTFDATLTFDPIDLKVWNTQDKDGVWETWVETSNPNWKINSIHSEVTPFQKPRNFHAMLGTLVVVR